MWRRPWTLALYREYGAYFSLASFLRFRRAVIAGAAGRLGVHGRLDVRLTCPPRAGLTLRPMSADLDTFREVFIDEVYGEAARRLRRVETIIDLGGNVGMATMYFLGRFPGARVLVVEPDPGNIALLERNLAAGMRRGTITVLRGALARSDGPVVYSEPEEAGHFNSGSIDVTALARRSARDTMVDGLTIASIVGRSGFSRVDLLKVDVEGGERYLFADGTGWLQLVGAIAVEFHDDARQASRFDEIVTAAGFGIVDTGHTVLAVRQAR